MIEIQILAPDDWPLWRELRLQALADSPAVFGSTLAEWSGPHDTEARWRSRLTDVPLNFLVRLDGIPQGMAGATLHTDGSVLLISLWVAPTARGRGIGDAAIRTVVDWAGDRDVILSVKSDNKNALALYHRHGFLDDGPSPDPGERILRRHPLRIMPS